jgi:CheY-like chemotaxis protein
MLKMLRQLIGENIDLIWLPEGSPCLVKMDPVQIGQILANLCVNARDAIADVGKITIETSKAVFDEIYCAHHPGSVPGKYVMLTIRDDGCGMEKGILDQIFEPFFTSKEIDQGSGLGLSSVYGIVKQNNGFIDVDSEPGKGSTFRIYLPLSAGKIVDARREKTSEFPRSHGETILVVEDEPALLALDKTMLEKLGYRVLTAGTPSEAFKLAEEHINEINLLITDVIMPEMNGQKLAQQLQSLYPDIKVLFISGYSSDVINHQGDPDKDLNFIQKPFFLKDLAAKVRDALEEK